MGEINVYDKFMIEN